MGMIDDFLPNTPVLTAEKLLYPFAIDIFRNVGFPTVGQKKVALKFFMIAF